MVGARAVRPKAKGDVEAGLAHGAVALVVVGGQENVARGIALGLRHGALRVADLHGIARAEIRGRRFALVFRTLRGLWLVDLGNVVASLRVQQEVSGNAAISVGFVL